MRILEERKTNYDARSTAVDAAGNPMIVASFGLIRFVPGAVILATMQGYRIINEIIAPHFMSAGRRIRTSEVEIETERLFSELGLGASELARRIARNSRGRRMTDELLEIISRVRLSPAFTPGRGTNAAIPDSFGDVDNQFEKKKLPEWERAIAGNRMPCLDDLAERFVNMVEDLKTRKGCYFTLKVLEVLEQRLEAEVAAVRSQAKVAGENRKRASQDLARNIAKIREVTQKLLGRFNLFTERAVTEEVDEGFVHLETFIKSQLVMLTMNAVEEVYLGLKGEDASVTHPGISALISKTRADLEAVSGQWAELAREFKVQYEGEIERLHHPRSSFIKVVGESMDRTDLEALYQDLVTRPGLTTSLIEAIERLSRENIPRNELGGRVFECVQERIEPLITSRTIEDFYADRDRHKIEHLAEQIGQSRAFCPLKVDVLKRQGLAPEDLGFTLITVPDVEDSVLREQLPRVSRHIQADDFASTGRDEIVATSWIFGAPIYAYRYVPSYRSDYERILRNPSEKSLSAVPGPENLPEIEEPEQGAFEMAEELLVLGLASGLIVCDDHSRYALAQGGRSLGNRDHAIATITKDLTLRFETLKAPIDRWLGSAEAREDILNYYKKLSGDEPEQDVVMLESLFFERFSEELESAAKPRRGRPRKKDTEN